MSGYLSGVFDLFHVGHLDLLQRAAARCDRLVVGVLTDEWAEQRRGARPYVPLIERQQIVGSLRCVHEVMVTNGLAADELRALGVDLVFVGEDLVGAAALGLTGGGPAVVELPARRVTDSVILRATLGQRPARTSVA